MQSSSPLEAARRIVCRLADLVVSGDLEPYVTACDAVTIFREYTFSGNPEWKDLPNSIRYMYGEIEGLYDRFYAEWPDVTTHQVGK